MPGAAFDETRLDGPGADGPLALSAASAAGRLRAARSAALEAGLDRLAEDGRPRAAVAVGTGIGGLAGELAAAVLGPGCPVPFSAVRGPLLPGWVSSYDLVLAVSGPDAEEPAVACAAEAVRRGCRLVAAGPPDGPLRPLAEQARAPYIELRGAGAPAGGFEPVWGPAAALLTAAGAAGLPAPGGDVFEAAAVRLEQTAVRCAPSVESWENPAKSLALELAGSLPVAVGATGPTAFAAAYTAERAARTAGYPVLHCPLPDALAAAVRLVDGPLGGTGPRSIFDDPEEEGPVRTRLLLFRDPGEESERTALDLRSAEAAAERGGAPVSTVSADPGYQLERIAGLIALTDYATVYLAAAYGVEPVAEEHTAG